MSDPATTSAMPSQRVVVQGLDIPFGRLVVFFIKAALAAIPAALAVMAIFMVLGLVLRAVFGFGHWGYGHY